MLYNLSVVACRNRFNRNWAGRNCVKAKVREEASSVGSGLSNRIIVNDSEADVFSGRGETYETQLVCVRTNTSPKPPYVALA